MSYRIAGIIKNDFSAAPGVCLSIFVQGCPLHCPDCHNPEQQDFDGGKKYTFDIQDEILEAIKANGLTRTVAIMGGEPCCEENASFTEYLISMVKVNYPEIPVYVWSGYTLEQLENFGNEHINRILETADFLVDGPYIKEERDITLAMRGSRNQRVIDLKTKQPLDI